MAGFVSAALPFSPEKIVQFKSKLENFEQEKGQSFCQLRKGSALSLFLQSLSSQDAPLCPV